MKKFFALAIVSGLTIAASAISVEVEVYRHSYCGRESGYAQAYVSGGVPPYTYNWSNGTSDSWCVGLFPGNHSLTVTDSQLDQATANFTVDLLTEYGFFGYYSSLPRCAGDDAIVPAFPVMQDYDPTVSFGPAPFFYTSPENPWSFTSVECQDVFQTIWTDFLVFPGVSPGEYTVDFTDGNGCPGTFGVHISPELADLPQVQAVNVFPSCASSATGSISFAHDGPAGHEFLVLLRPDGVTDECAPEVQTTAIGASAPAGTRVFTNLLPGEYWLITSTDVGRVLTGTPLSGNACKDSALVSVPSLGTDCGVLSGRVYIDDDADCTLDGAENRVPATIVEILPGPHYVTTNSSGLYSIGLNFGSYTVTEQHPVFEQSCPGTVTLASGVQTRNVGCAGGELLDVQLSMANGPARPGFELGYAIDLDNLTPASTGVVTLTVTLDPALGYLSATPAPSSIAGNVLTWTSPQLVMNQVFQHRDINIRTQVPSDVGLIGSTLTTTAQFTSATTDGNLANNAAVSNQLVTGSFDPNDKVATTSSGSNSVWLIDQDQWIDYTIRFQNTGTDTAFNVIITDTLPAALDPLSIVWGAGSHTHSRALLGQGVLKFIFPNILLPDSNVNEAASHGAVSFRIRPRLPVVPGTTIANTANIYFDFNPPVITEPSVLAVTVPGVALSPRVLLGGPYVSTTQRMSDALRSTGLLPLTEPYTALGYPHVNGGGETTTPQTLAVTGDNALVDWVVVEVRSATSPYAVVATRSALLQRDGDVVGTNGTGPVFFDLAAGNYRVAVRHRNHLGAMTNTALALGSTATVVDFSEPATATYGTNAQATVGGRRVLWAGDVRGDGDLLYTGTANDRDLILQAIGGVAPTATTTGYLREDVNMDGVVKYTGAANDRDVILQGIGGVVPTNVVVEQLP